MKRIRVTAIAGVLVASGATAVASTTAAGGLSIAPAFLEHEAQPGPVGQIRVANGSAKALAVTVRARPWIQERGGAVRPDGRRTLAQVRLSATTFTLAPGEARTVSAALLSRPAAGSLYGTLDVLGTPQGTRPATASWRATAYSAGCGSTRPRRSAGCWCGWGRCGQTATASWCGSATRATRSSRSRARRGSWERPGRCARRSRHSGSCPAGSWTSACVAGVCRPVATPRP